MEAGITITLEGGRKEYAAGDALKGTVAWESPGASEDAAELSVLWYTEGKGDQNTGVVHFEEFALDDRRKHTFAADLPLLPLTYHGHLLKIHWLVRVRTGSGRNRNVRFQLPFIMKASARTAAEST